MLNAVNHGCITWWNERGKSSSCAISTATVDPTPPLSPCKDLSGGGNLNSFGPKLGSRRYGWSGDKNLRVWLIVLIIACIIYALYFSHLCMHIVYQPSETSNTCLPERSLPAFSHDFAHRTGCVIWCATAKPKIEFFSFLIRFYHKQCCAKLWSSTSFQVHQHDANLASATAYRYKVCAQVLQFSGGWIEWSVRNRSPQRPTQRWN